MIRELHRGKIPRRTGFDNSKVIVTDCGTPSKTPIGKGNCNGLCSTNSVISTNIKPNVIISPNPSNGKVHISLTDVADYSINLIEIFDISGKYINSIIVNDDTVSINLPNMSGVYFLKIHTKSQILVSKVFKI